MKKLGNILPTLIAATSSQFIRYLLVGGWNTIFGMAIYATLHHWLGSHIHYLLLLIPANILAIANAFLCYKLFVFRTRGNALREYLRCHAVYGIMMLVGAALLFLQVECLGLHPIVANCACIVITTIISYFAHRHFSFVEKNIVAPECLASNRLDLSTLIFWSAVIVAGLCHLASMQIIPLPWTDEIHILEMGRIALARGNLATTFMMNADGKSSFMVFYYLGPVLQELCYQLAGLPGTRLAPMLGLILATCFCRAWLLKRGLSRGFATSLALIVLCNPLLVQSVRIVRVDSWALAFLFTTLFFMWRSVNHSIAPRRLDFFIAGLCATTAIFVWPTALVFVCFYLAELTTLRHRYQLSQHALLNTTLAMGCGTVLAAIFWLLPFVTQIPLLIANLTHYFAGQGIERMPGLRELAYGFAVCTLKESLRSPFFTAAVLLGLTGVMLRIKKHISLLVCFLLALFLCIRSGLHSFRYLYLFPFFLVFALQGLESLHRRWPKVGVALLTCMLAYGFTTGYFALPAMASVYKHRSLNNVTAALNQVIGSGAKRVYSRTMQTYYPARLLGWQHYRYAQDRLILEDSRQARLLTQVDYVIDAETQPQPYYAVEESYTLYTFLRNVLIQSANSQAHAVDPEALSRLQKFCARWGAALAFSVAPQTEQALFEQTLIADGFQKITTLTFIKPAPALPYWQKWLLARQVTNPDYDNLIIWQRTRP